MTAPGELSALGKEPIGPDRPSGADVRYEPLFDQLQAEIDRSALPSQAGAVDWEKVVALAADILAHKSKDLQVAGYLAVGLIHTGGIGGLADSLRIFCDLLEYHGDGLFPQRERGRQRSIQWWLEKCEVALKPWQDSAVDAVQLTLLENDLEKLGRFLGILLQEPPSLQALSGFLGRLAPSPAGNNDQPPAADINQSPVVGGVQAGTVAPLDKSPAVRNAPSTLQPDHPGALEERLQRLRETAAMLRNRDIADPLAYRLSRAAVWLTVADLPPTNDALTQLPPPTDRLRNQLAELRRAGDSGSLLQVVEGQLSQHIFWLDLNRLAAEALSNLGSLQAAVAVGQETSFLLQRLPGLDRLAFADATPFADAATGRWLERLHPRQKNRAIPSLQATSITRPEPDIQIRLELDSIRVLIDQGQPMAAGDLLQKRLNDSRSEKERIRWRLAFSGMLMEAEQIGLALPLLELLLTDVERYRLENYDPPAALEVLRLARHGYLQCDPPCTEKANDIIRRIARLDVAEMVRLSKNE